MKAHSPLVIHHKEVREFDNLFADYLKAKGEAIRGPEIDSDEEGEKLFELSWNLFWKLVQTPAPQRRQIDDKFQALFLEMSDGEISRTERAMLESIRYDIGQDN